MSSKRKDSHPSKNTTTTITTVIKESPSVDRLDTEESEDAKMDENETVTTFGGSGATVVTTDPTATWSSFGNGTFKPTKNGNNSQLGALLASGGQNSQNNSAPSPSLSDNTIDTSGHDDASSSGAKDDDDDDDDDDVNDDKIDGQLCGDPEKLKAFNMFVRLFVDENLDRHVPISKQPKEKIQAIIDSCTRQFPEHSTRARKRIRTYLKSCRRTKRTREQAGLDGSNARPAPPHLTSVQAEQLLARACENESENAKRMRMGLEPISQPMPVITTTIPAMSSETISSSMSTLPTYSLLQGATGSSVNPVATAPSAFGTVAINNLSNELLAAQQIALATQPGGPPMKQLKTEYKPEQLASLLQAAASQPLSMASITPATVASVAQQHQLLLTQSPLPPLQTQPPLSIVASGTNAAAAAAAILSPGNPGLQLQQGNALPILPGLNGNLTTGIPANTVVSPSTTIAATANLYRQTLQQQQTQLQQNNAAFPALQNSAPVLQNGCSTPDSLNGQTVGATKKPALLNHKLNNTEITAVRQLVTGYRESAAFLLRSADELEHLLQIQPKL